MQLLFSTGKTFTADGLREKLREFFREVRAKMRAVATLSHVELISALLSCDHQLALSAFSSASSMEWFRSSLQKFTTKPCPSLSEQTGANESSHLRAAELEVLACVAFKQPLSQGDIDRLFDL